MHKDFEFISSLQCQVKAQQKQLAAFRSGEKYAQMRSEYEKQARQKNREIRKLKSELADSHKENRKIWDYAYQAMDDQEADFRKKLIIKDRKIKTLEERALRAEKQRDDALDEITRLRRELTAVQEALKEEQEKNKELKAQLNRDYENSSLPSSDKRHHGKIPNGRVPSGKKQGGQPGHKGHLREPFVPTEEAIRIETPKEIRENPDYYYTGYDVFKQLVDISVTLNVREYETEEWRRHSNGTRYHAPFPEGMTQTVNYGPGIKALAFYLTSICNVSIRKARELIRDLTGGAADLSVGMINRLNHEFSKKTKAERQEIFSAIFRSPVQYTDGTTGRVNGSGKSVTICTDKKHAAFFFREGKGHKGVKGTPVEHYHGTLVHDHDTTLYHYGDAHQECLAHILRYLKGSMENEQELSWNKSMHAFLRRMIHEVKESNRQVSEEACQQYEKEYDRILSVAAEEYEKNPPGKYYRDGYNLQKRMREYKEAHLYFLRHPEVDFTNNISERLARKYKRKQIQAVTFRDMEHPEKLCDALTIIETARLQGKNLFDVAKKAFT